MDILKSLTRISTDYSFFERDQVLTHDQLNSISGYLDDQDRLTRVNLLGVGIACGLRVSLQGDVVKVSKGAGITTDGDILYFNNDTTFDKFKLYDKSKPAYAPFYVNGDTTGEMITVYELVRQGAVDELSASLNQFNAQTGNTLGNMVAVLLMESYKTDRDICSGTDCDNLGQDCINSIKLLLVDKASAGRLLKQDVITPHQAFGKLNEVAAERPLITSSDNSLSLIASKYRTSCTAIYKKLINELANLYRYCSGFTGDIFASDPAVDWETKLLKLNTAFESRDGGIQYYYDFLKDVAETYNHFRELLFGDETWCCPDLEAFSKHLLLGNLALGTYPEENRTGFYPSPLVSRTAEQLKHAKFLLQKIDALIQTFKVPVPGSEDIRITPSMFEDQPLEERAIPYYYQMDTAKPVNKFWNYRLHQRGMDASNYSYNAAMYGGEAKPLELQIGRFSFFRIEGHMGQNVSKALSAIESEIKSNNLSFTICSVMLGKEKTKVVKKPGLRYTDLHRFHYMLRQDVSHRLEEVEQFSGKFKAQVDAITSEGNAVVMKADAAGKHSTITEKAPITRTKLNRSYADYKTDPTWRDSLSDTIKAAGEFKQKLSNVVKTEFTTPFDSLIGNTHIQWLNDLDTIINQKDEKEDEKLLFSGFISRHPGVEHFAGVVRGGTFVLVYDKSFNVVADFMLPYYYCDTAEEAPEEPPLKNPGVIPQSILESGISILPSRDKFIADKLDRSINEGQLKEFVRNKMDTFKTEHVDSLQNEYFSAIKDSHKLMGDALIGKKSVAVEGAGSVAFKDLDLGQKVKDINEKRQAADYHRKMAGQPELSMDKKKMHEDAAKDIEMELADTVTKAARYIAEKGLDMSLGSEGMTAMVEINKGFEAIKDAQTLEAATTSLEKVKETSTNTGLNMAMGSMLGRRR